MTVTYPRSEVWTFLKERSNRRHSGTHLVCSLLGRVGWERIEGEMSGVIPHWLQDEAKDNGFKIIGADFRNDSYILEILE